MWPAPAQSGYRIARDHRSREGSVGSERWRVYIGNLPYDADGADLGRLAFPWGTVVGADVARDAETGRSKGFGWVDMGCESEATAAAAGLSHREYRGRRLTAWFCNPPLPRDRRYGPARLRADWALMGLAPGGPWEGFGLTELRNLCREFGRVMLVEVDEQSPPGQGQGSGIVEMASAAAARAAIAGLDGREYGGYRLTARALKPWEDSLMFARWKRRREDAARPGDPPDDRGSPSPELIFSPIIMDLDSLAKLSQQMPIVGRGHDSQPWPQRTGNDPREEKARGSIGGTCGEAGGEKSQRERDRR